MLPNGSSFGNDSPFMKKFFTILIATTGLLLIFIGGGVLYIYQSTINPQAVNLPKSIAGSEIVLKSEGWRAVDELQRLHQQDFPLSGGAVGSYGMNQESKLWVSESPFQFMAKRMTRAMLNKIASVNSPFTPTGEFQDGKRTVYELDGMNQKHYYFQSGKLVIWLATDADTAEQSIQDALNFYP